MQPSSPAPAAASPTLRVARRRFSGVRLRTCAVADELPFSRLHVYARDHGHGCSGWLTRRGLHLRAQAPSPSDCAPTATPLRLGLVLPLLLLYGVLTTFDSSSPPDD